MWRTTGQDGRRVAARVRVATEAETRREKKRRVRAREGLFGDGLGAVGIVGKFRAVWYSPLCTELRPKIEGCQNCVSKL